MTEVEVLPPTSVDLAIVLRCCDSISKSTVEQVRETIRDMMNHGAHFGDGETIQFGTGLLLLERRNNRLYALEPDYRSMPIAWIDGISTTLAITQAQLFVTRELESDDPEPFSSIQHCAVVGNDFGPRNLHLVLHRIEQQGNDSGWFIGNRDSKLDYDDPKNLTRKSLYECIIQSPCSAACLMLPANTYVEIDTASFEIKRHNDSPTAIDLGDTPLRSLCTRSIP